MNQFGDYELKQEIGRGGTATVYLATHTPTGESVCLKVFHPSVLTDASSRKRIEREYQLLLPLKHPNLISVREVVAHDKGLALVMDYQASDTLERFQPRLPYTLPEVSVLIVIEILRAIDFAHAKGIIHRDLKPENILVGKEGRIFVTDFGLAKVESQSTAITQATHIVGTVGFMSPEQALAQPLGPASDLFSVGSVLYFLVTGVRPFAKATAVETLSAIQKETPEPAHLRNPKVSLELSALIHRALEKTPGRRFSNASEFAVALSHYLNGLGLGPQAFSFADWFEDPTGTTMEALRLASDALVVRGEAAVKQQQWSQVLQIASHLAIKAPHSSAIATWASLRADFQKEQKKKATLRALALALLLLLLGTGLLYFARRTTPEVPTVAVTPTIPPPATGEVQFKLNPAIQVFWDGKRVPSDQPLTGVPVGRHELRMERPGFDPIVTHVEVTATKPAVIQAE